MPPKPFFKINKSVLAFPLLLAIVLGMMGATHALWSETLKVNVTVNTGELKACFVRAYLSDTENVTGVGYNDYVGTVEVPPGAPGTLEPDIPCESFADGVAVIHGDLDYNQANKDHAWGTAELLDPDGDGNNDTVVVTLYNTYPGYVTWLSIEVENTGTIPLFFDYYIVNGTTLTKLQIGANWLAFLDSDGDCKPEIAVQLIDVLGQQMEPGDERECSIRLIILQDANMSATYKIYIQLVAVQWSESIYYSP
ncbi:MAG: hypothetical protein ACXQTI_07115 [Candidatus Nezhaarchaeales archaeon]